MVSVGAIIISTYPNEQSAVDIANRVVKTKLCACVNFSKMRSIYSWKDEIEDQQEFIAFFKTTKKASKKLKREIARLHPYEVPEIVELRMTDVSSPYLHWLLESTNGKPKKRHNASKR